MPSVTKTIPAKAEVRVSWKRQLVEDDSNFYVKMYPIVDIIPDIDNVQERLTTRAAAKEIIEKSLDEAKVSYKSKNWKITMKRG